MPGRPDQRRTLPKIFPPPKDAGADRGWKQLIHQFMHGHRRDSSAPSGRGVPLDRGSRRASWASTSGQRRCGRSPYRLPDPLRRASTTSQTLAAPGRGRVSSPTSIANIASPGSRDGRGRSLTGRRPPHDAEPTKTRCSVPKTSRRQVDDAGRALPAAARRRCCRVLWEVSQNSSRAWIERRGRDRGSPSGWASPPALRPRRGRRSTRCTSRSRRDR